MGMGEKWGAFGCFLDVRRPWGHRGATDHFWHDRGIINPEDGGAKEHDSHPPEYSPAPESRSCSTIKGGRVMPHTLILLIVILLLVGAFPSWPYSRNWGYYPSGLLGLILLILVIKLVTGRL